MTINVNNKVKTFLHLGAVLIFAYILFLGIKISFLPQFLITVLVVVSGVLLLLYAYNLDAWLSIKFSQKIPRIGLLTYLTCVVVSLSLSTYLSNMPDKPIDTSNAHNLHVKQAQQNAASTAVPSKRFSVSFSHSPNPKPKQKVQLTIEVYEANTGAKVKKFNLFEEKLMHLIIVDSSWEFFNHIHPEFKDGKFVIETEFPKDGMYHLYTDFEPAGATEQQYGFSLDVGNATHEQKDWKEDLSTKKIDNYEVSVKLPQKLKAKDMTVGKQTIKFSFKDINTNQPFDNLKPYLGAFGHLVMINTKTYDYVHVHPIDQSKAAYGGSGGPDVDFNPLGITGPITPGTYRTYAQFNPDDKLIVAEFTLVVE